ncbi:hypothetical protein G4Z05_00605 [Bacillus thermocopriae]|uniref:Uncharacterized protein n=1 Tax=Neobacillus thermocopriae TaxID=1215031 RepID=A0A6B3TMG4_9BACI|nr:hypothetical protein [Neobacillus thermocopriae]NEX77401.1 hypothetical protein [Neobacillus thermocopriae]
MTYVIRGKRIMFQSCQMDNLGQEETYETYEQAEIALKKIQDSIPFDTFEIRKLEDVRK